MAIEIQKAIDRAYLRKQLELLAGHELYEVVEIEEDYTRAKSTDPDALLVVDDSIVTPGDGEVGKSVVQPYIMDIAVGDYVIHSPAHKEVMTKYAPRVGEDMSDEDMEDIWDVDSEEVQAYKSLIQDDKISKITLYSSQKVVDSISENEKTLKEYIDSKIAKTGTVSLKLVTALPDEPQENILYILQDASAGTNTIYIYDGTKWVDTGVDLGSIDFSDYYTKAETDAKLDDYAKIDTVVLVSDLKADLDMPNNATAPTTKAVADALNKIVSGDIDLSGYAKTENLTDGSVTKVGTATVGSVSKGIYLKDGVPTEMTHSVEKDVPSDAVFTDTTYGDATSTKAGLVKLYTSTGTNTDGTMNQNSIKIALDNKVDIDQGSANAGKALVIGTDGKVTTGDAGVSVSKETNNAIESKTDGIFVKKYTTANETTEGYVKLYKESGENEDGTMTQKAIKALINEKIIYSSSEPEGQSEGDVWMEEY